MTVVEARSYSRNSGATSCEATTCADGWRRRSSSATRALVLRVPEGEEEADGDRVGVERGKRVEVERRELAVLAHAPVHAEAALERHERRRMLGARPVEVRTRLAPEMQEVLEAAQW